MQSNMASSDPEVLRYHGGPIAIKILMRWRLVCAQSARVQFLAPFISCAFGHRKNRWCPSRQFLAVANEETIFGCFSENRKKLNAAPAISSCTQIKLANLGSPTHTFAQPVAHTTHVLRRPCKFVGRLNTFTEGARQAHWV